MKVLTLASFSLILASAALIGCGGDSSTAAGAAGEQLVKDNGCADCHQSPKASDGTLSGSTSAPKGYDIKGFGSNLTPDKATGIGTWTDDDIKDAILSGKRNDDTNLCELMPIFSSKCDPNSGKSCLGPLSDDDVAAITKYLRSLKAVSHKIPKSPCTMTD